MGDRSDAVARFFGAAREAPSSPDLFRPSV
jgi:hypothetical protein